MKYYDNPDRTSNIWRFGYELTSDVKLTGNLYLVINKADYIAYDVPLELFDDFRFSDSKGSFFNRKIKGKFKIERVSHD